MTSTSSGGISRLARTPPSPFQWRHFHAISTRKHGAWLIIDGHYSGRKRTTGEGFCDEIWLVEVGKVAPFLLMGGSGSDSRSQTSVEQAA